MTALTDSLGFPMLRRNSAPGPAQCLGLSRQSQWCCDPLQGSPRPRSTRPGSVGAFPGPLHGSMMTDAPAEALGFDAPGSILGLTRGGRARGVKSVPRGGAQAGDQRRSSSSSRLTSADGACRMRPVGVRTDTKSPCSSFRPGRESGVLTGRMVKGFVVSAPAVRARQHMGLHGLHPGNTGLPPPGSAVRPVGEGPGKTRGPR